MMIRTAALLAIMATAGAAAPGQKSCDLHGLGRTPSLVVRAAPAAGARVLATVPRRAASERGQDVNGTNPEFHISAGQNGWFRVDHIGYGDYGDPAPLHRVFAGQGWVIGVQIGGSLGNGRIYAAPSEKAHSRPYGKDPDAVSIRRLIDCQGNWARIDSDIGTGWVKGICNNQVTTCV